MYAGFLFPFFLLGVNWGLSNVAMITAVNQVVAPDKIGGAIGTIATIWNLAGSIFLSTSTAIFYSAEIRSSFLPAFYKTINFNIAFAAILSIAAIWVHIGLKKNNTI